MRSPARAGLALVLHELLAVDTLSFELIVRSTTQPKVLDGCRPSSRHRNNVVIFEIVA